MNKKVIKFPNNSEINKNLESAKFLNVEFENKQDEKDLIESIKILEKIKTAKSIKEIKEYLEEAIEKSVYNVEAQFMNIIYENSVPTKVVKECLEYRRQLQMAPIKVKDFRELFINNLYKKATDLLAQYYYTNKMYGRIDELYSEIILLSEEIKDFEERFILLTLAQLETDSYKGFSRFYANLSPELKEHQYYLLCKLIFDIRRNDEEAAKEALGILKYNTPYIDIIFSILIFRREGSKAEGFEEQISDFLEVSGALLPYLTEDYVRSYLMYLNVKVKDGDELDRKMKARGVSLDELKKKAIFTGLTSQCINALRKAGFIEEKDFLEVSEYYLLHEVSYVGKKSVEQLKKNGVKFRGNI